ncbi:MAG: hypothetical protein U0805_12245 [Pirellulales bacterium]
MFSRLIPSAALVLGLAPACFAASLNVQIFPITGEVRFQNTSAIAVPFVFYTIASPSGTLNSGGWTSIADNYDVSGNGLIDPLTNWSEFAASPTQITEGATSGGGGSLPAGRSISLGHIWFPFQYPANDLSFTILQANQSPVAVTTQYAVAGDYNSDNVVNNLDLDLWRSNFGSLLNLAADGNLNGVVDAADYVVWRNNLGQALPGFAANSGLLLGGRVVPEPTTIGLAWTGLVAMITAASRTPRSAHRERPRP